MGPEIIVIALLVLQSRSIYQLCKEYNKPAVSYIALGILAFLVGIIVLSFITVFTLFMTLGEERFKLDLLMKGLFIVNGIISLNLYRWILQRAWKKSKSTTENKSDVLDDFN